jgi:hypothetical protein
VLAPQVRRLDLGRRMIEGPGAQPFVSTAGGLSAADAPATATPADTELAPSPEATVTALLER